MMEHGQIFTKLKVFLGEEIKKRCLDFYVGVVFHFANYLTKFEIQAIKYS